MGALREFLAAAARAFRNTGGRGPVRGRGHGHGQGAGAGGGVGARSTDELSKYERETKSKGTARAQKGETRNTTAKGPKSSDYKRRKTGSPKTSLQKTKSSTDAEPRKGRPKKIFPQSHDLSEEIVKILANPNEISESPVSEGSQSDDIQGNEVSLRKEEGGSFSRTWEKFNQKFRKNLENAEETLTLSDKFLDLFVKGAEVLVKGTAIASSALVVVGTLKIKCGKLYEVAADTIKSKISGPKPEESLKPREQQAPDEGIIEPTPAASTTPSVDSSGGACDAERWWWTMMKSFFGGD